MDPSDDFEVLTPAQVRHEFVPDLSGMQIWRKSLTCDYCQSNLDGTVIMLKWQAPAINFMCLECFGVMATKAVG